MGKRKQDTTSEAAPSPGPTEPPKKQRAKTKENKEREVLISVDEKLEERFITLCEQHPGGVHEDVLQSSMGDVEIVKRASVINSLLQRGRLQLFKLGNSLVYKLVGTEDAKRFRGLGPEEMLVYQLIEKEARNGIWIKHLRGRSNLPQQTILKILKMLQGRQLIKTVTHAESKQKLFMLYDLEPTEEMLGRAWGAGKDLDENFVAALKKICLKGIGSKGSASAEELLEYTRGTGVIKAPLTIKDVVTIVESLTFDGVIERDPQAEAPLRDLPAVRKKALQKYRTLKKNPLVSPFLYVPCSACPVADKCADNGVINPTTCPYLGTWLDF